ncbi:metallophosphoesterase, partial [Streptomyces sp. WELS2]|uniref:metallophosphoesterase n=1 Tax=Streptomyces sp. WELS2 TaxID=2749435 RepID=UPI0028682E01
MSDSSRDTAQGAGWGEALPGTYRRLMPDHVEQLSWLNPRILWAARNGVLASWFGDPTGRTRSRWVARRAEAGAPADKVIRRDVPESFSFMVIGDTGEGGESQYAVVPGFLTASQGTEFAVLASDVVYPVGGADDYGDKFFRPFQDYPAPVYAIPGNHDWYEDLGAFMRVFCADTPPPDPVPAELLQSALDAFALHDLDARLAELTFDSLVDALPVRGAMDPPRMLTFRAGEVTVDVEVTGDGLIGQLLPPQSARIELLGGPGHVR